MLSPSGDSGCVSPPPHPLRSGVQAGLIEENHPCRNCACTLISRRITSVSTRAITISLQELSSAGYSEPVPEVRELSGCSDTPSDGVEGADEAFSPLNSLRSNESEGGRSGGDFLFSGERSWGDDVELISRINVIMNLVME